jgi:co-chaperonin GroES (HSP10)
MNLLRNNIIIPGNNLLIKRFPFVQEEQVTESGLTISKFDSTMTDAGTLKVKVDDVTYSSVGEVIAVGTGEECEDFKVGDIVSVHPVFFERGNYVFFTERSTPISENEGYARVPVANIECIIRD